MVERVQDPRTIERLLQRLVAAEGSVERRVDERIEISLAVAVIPCVDNVPMPDYAFAAFTRNISSDGVSLVINRPLPSDELLIGFPGSPMTFVIGKVLHVDKLALGCSRVGVKMNAVVDAPSHPGLEKFLMQ